MKHTTIIASSAFLLACGGSVLEETSSSGDTTTGTTTGATTGSTVAATTSGTSGVGPGSGGSGQGGSSSDVGGPGSGGAGPGSGGSGQGGGSVVGSSVSTGSGVPPILCGEASCDAATEQCCATFNGAACVGAGDPCEGVALLCSSSAQCDAGEVCCATGLGPGGGGVADCAPECGGGGPGQSVQLCETEAECPPDQPCTELPGGAGFKVCQPPFGP